ncbi:S8 family peptidase [uncultured Jannaschia sp.]|uniref:S8 family peptidase n=1 Tax=uncultured Jannaschia sp. TaxID=293347 RepID=UPI0026157B02|nr:S8 family peptidase [uncultured Jannaschia sp.]
MAQLDHLQLIRAREPIARRKTGGGGAPPERGGGHGGALRTETQAAVAEQQAAKPAAFVDPSLLLRVQVDGHIAESEWERLGLSVVSSDVDRTVLLFSTTGDVTEFLERLGKFDAPPVNPGQRNPNYAGLVGRIDKIGGLAPRDRLGPKIKAEGFTEAEDLQDDTRYVLDIELWEFGTRPRREAKVEEIEQFLIAQGGAVYDTYIGPSITVMRVEATGRGLRPLLGVPEIALIDLPPEPDLEAQPLVALEAGGVPPVLEPPVGAPVIGVLDSGVNDHPLLNGLVVGSYLGEDIADPADVWGHGTSVAGTALFGDLRDAIPAGALEPVGRVAVAKVVGDNGRFPERRTVPRVMDTAIRTLHADQGCRLFVLSLGDTNANLPQGRVGPWAATLDALARELDVLIVVSAGNRGRPRPFNSATSEELVTVYPTYLLEPENRLAEPAGAANVVTVGAVAGGTGLDARHAQDANVRPITQEWGEPSPFTRVGPGAGGARKPDVVDLGGTAVFDVPSISLVGAPHLPAAGVITLNHRYTEQFLTAAGGTSFAAPLLIHKAARLLRRMPNASANLLRALLVGAARSPDAFERRLGAMTAAERVRIGGNGVVDPIRAAYSDDHRVVLYAEDALEMDQFAVYRLPIPPEFRTGGDRTIRVSLAYDPPVRRTRNDYLGTKMDFRLLRGIDEAELFEHFRDRNRTLEGAAPTVPNRFKCNLQPGSDERAGNTLQTASVTFKRDTLEYGEVYYLVVRCLSHWAVDQVLDQRFAVVVELEHRPEIRIYNRVRERVQVRA